MGVPFSAFALVGVVVLSVFLSSVSLLFWFTQREDNISLWLAAWLGVSAVFALSRFLQYAPQNEQTYILLPRILLTAGYVLAWLGYEFANSFISFRPPRWERILILVLVTAPILLLWTGNLIFTDQIVVRTVELGGKFHGVLAGPIYFPANFLILAVGVIAPIRLLKHTSSHKRENVLMALGYLFVIFFSLIDFFAVSFNLEWIRFSDYSYLPIAILFSYIQVRQFGRMFREMDTKVLERTSELGRTNATLLSEISEHKRVEEELRAVMQRLETLLEYMQTGILFEDDARHVALANRAFCEMFGIPGKASTLTGKDFKEADRSSILKMAGSEKFLERIETIIAEQRMVLAEELILADGRTFERDYIPILDNKTSLGHLWQYRDISERKQTEDAIKKAEVHYQALVEQIPAIAYTDSAEHKAQTLYISPQIKTILGIEPEAWLTDNDLWYKIMVEADRERVEVDYSRSIETGEPFGCEYRMVACNGRTIWIREDASLIRDAFGKPLFWQGIMVDITERKLTEEKIQRQADEMTALYMTTHDLVEEWDLSKLLHIIVERATGLLDTTSGSLYLCEPEKVQVRCVVSYNTPHDTSGNVLKYGEGVAGKVAETGSHLVIKDYRVWNKSAPTFEDDQSLISILGVPMHWQERIIGVIQVHEDSQREFTQEDLRILTMFADQAAIAIENSRLLEFERNHGKEAGALAEIGRNISATLQLDIVMEQIALYAKDLLHAETSAIYLSEPGSPVLRAIAAFGPDAEQIKNDPLTAGKGILGSIVIKRSGEIVNEATQDPRAIQIKQTEANFFEHLMAVPVLSREQLTGLIAVWRTGAGSDFKITELDFLGRLAGQVSVAIKNARLFENEQKQRHEADTLRQAAERITVTLDREQAIELILEQLAKVVQFESASVQLLGEGYLEIVGGSGLPDFSSVPGMRIPVPGDNPNSIVVLERRPLVLGNASAIYAMFESPPHTSIQSWLGVPLIVRDRVIGMFAVGHNLPNFFTDSDVHLVNAFASQAAIAIENARLFESTRRRLSEIEAVHTISTALRSAQALDQALPIILDQLMNLLNAEGASLETVDTANGEILTELAQGAWAPVTGLRTAGGVGISGRVIASGKPFVSTDVIANGEAVRPDLFGGLNSVVCVPVIAQNQPIGALWVGRRTPFREDEVSLTASIGEMAGNAIHRMRLHEQTEHLLVELEAANRNLSKAYDSTLEGWAKALELRDKETEGHSRRVVDLTLNLAKKLGISEPELTYLRRGILLHDIGKMGVSDQLLRKPTTLTDDEWIEMRKHPKFAYDLLSPIIYLQPSLDIPYCHHERWDGTGYPRNLKEKQIPLGARIFAIVDVYDALISVRPYRAAWPRQKVLSYLRAQSGKHFDPQVVEAFFELLTDKKLAKR